MNPITRQMLPKAEKIAERVSKEVAKNILSDINNKAEQWIGENKLIHAGAARDIQARLKKLLSEAK